MYSDILTFLKIGRSQFENQTQHEPVISSLIEHCKPSAQDKAVIDWRL